MAGFFTKEPINRKDLSHLRPDKLFDGQIGLSQEILRAFGRQWLPGLPCGLPLNLARKTVQRHIARLPDQLQTKVRAQVQRLGI